MVATWTLKPDSNSEDIETDDETSTITTFLILLGVAGLVAITWGCCWLLLGKREVCCRKKESSPIRRTPIQVRIVVIIFMKHRRVGRYDSRLKSDEFESTNGNSRYLLYTGTNRVCSARNKWLTYISLVSFSWDIGKQKSPRCDAAKRGIPSGAFLFANMIFIEI